MTAHTPVATMTTLEQALSWVAGAQLVGDGRVAFSRVHTDTRTVQAGDLFVALRGEHHDAHDFLGQARAAGAVALVAERGIDQAALPGLLVPDSLVALQALASAWRRRFEGPLITVTGSNGKTTVTQMLAAILGCAWGDAALATQGNLNNHIGVPLTLLRLRDHHRAAVLELGMNHPGEIAQLAAMAAPTVALVNNAQREHQEFMHSVEAVALENGAAIECLPRDGVAVFPADDARAAIWRRQAGPRRVLSFAADAEMPAVLTHPLVIVGLGRLEQHGDQERCVAWFIPWRSSVLSLGLSIKAPASHPATEIPLPHLWLCAAAGCAGAGCRPSRPG